MLRTTNVRRFRLVNDEPRIVKRRGKIQTIIVDGTKFRAVDVVGIDGWFERIKGKEWKVKILIHLKSRYEILVLTTPTR